MRERCLIVFDAIMNYCVRSLEIESDASMRCLEGLNEEDFYCTVLYNDETHTFEQVNRTFPNQKKRIIFFLINSGYTNVNSNCWLQSERSCRVCVQH